MMKRMFMFLLAFVAIMLTACNQKVLPTLDFDNKDIEIYVGEEFILNPKIENLDGDNLVDYSIKDSTIISKEGSKILALKAGTTTIEVYLKKYEDIKVTLNVTVLPLYEIKYNLDGGTLNKPVNSFKKVDLPLTLPLPTKDGFVFLGWYKNGNFTGEEVKILGTEVSSNQELFAKWKKVDFKITYYLNGGSLESPITGFNEENLPLTLPIPTMENHKFLGWYLNSDFTGEAITEIAAGTKEDINLYAKWEKLYSIKYQLNEGILSNPINNFGKSDLPLTLPIPTRDGYNFLGWYLNSDFTGEAITLIAAGVEANVSVYAKWEKVIPVDYSKVLVYPTSSSKEEGELISYNNVIFIVGKTAFSSIQDAIKASTKTVYIMPGAYNDTFNINKSNIEILGPNHRIDPNTGARTPEAILNNIINITAEVSNVTLSGLAFTGGAQIKNTLPIENFDFTFNNVYDTADATSTWTVGTGNVNAFLSLYNTNTDPKHISQNIQINNNKFNSVPEYIISLARVNNVYITNNSFKNFQRDAIRLDGGFNGGIFAVHYNEFENDTQGGYNGIYFRIYGGDNNSVLSRHTIEIFHNTFKNIGKNVDYSGAISARNYQEFGAKFSILYNHFETCYNYIFLRNNGTEANHSAYKWISEINHNAFIGEPNRYYFDSWLGSDNATTNPPLTNFDKNYFENNDNEVITDLTLYADKILRVASYAENYQTKAAYDTYVSNIKKQSPTKIYINNPIFNMEVFAKHQLDVTILPEGIAKRVSYSSSDISIATVSADGLITALKEGVVIITAKSTARPSLIDTIEITISKSPYIETSYSGNSALQAGEKRNVNYTVYNVPANESIVWTSSNENVAKVDQNGVVTAVGVGNVIITLKSTKSNLEAQVGFTIYGSEITDPLLQYLIELNRGKLFTKSIEYIGGTRELNRIYNTVNTYLAAPKDPIILNMLDSSRSNYVNKTMDKIEYITIHDTGNSSSGSNAQANSNYHKNTSPEASWHYTVGNDGVYKQLDDKRVALHAGDGTGVPFVREDTGVKASTAEPVVTITSDGFFAFNGTKSNVKAPLINGNIAKTSDIAPMGILSIIGDNGNYWIAPTYYNGTYKRISNRGGNLASIGIETAINHGSDVFWTWQKTAKLTAELLTTHNLTPNRVVYHNNFSGKVCPQTMMTAGLVHEFEAMVEAEYNIYKKYSDYTITFESHNPEIVDNLGRVINAPVFTTNITYTITVTKGAFIQSITLNSLVPGQYDWR